MGPLLAVDRPLPPDADPAIGVIRRLTDAGHVALLAGGCVRDLLRDAEPHDFDVATDALPDRVCSLFKATRKVGVQFGVVLVKQRGVWVEVATFRSDGPYADGRHPEHVTFSDAEHDARRRDFTINGMFLDPLARRIVDYVGGQTDLQRGIIRAIGDPAARFAEDHLRLIRAVRFAARLGFEIEPQTWNAIVAAASQVGRVAAERIREELEKMLAHPGRGGALRLLGETGLLQHLWPQPRWDPTQTPAAVERLAALPPQAGFEAAFAMLTARHDSPTLERIARSLAFSNEQREAVGWLVEKQAVLDDADAPSLAEFKTVMAHRAFRDLAAIADARYSLLRDGDARRARLAARIASIRPESVQPPPLVRGDDLLALGVRAGPVYKQVLDELYRRQLNEELQTREQAAAALQELLRTLPQSPGEMP
ncbi:tRNA nucleotidyltransferase/poly(A) polymerase [Phycisphaerae bacterium RAS1]|nr:tRNA nucleotidyltransferase/poly(A) polymerase [Phycisphaerae bacterium RAS1]